MRHTPTPWIVDEEGVFILAEGRTPTHPIIVARFFDNKNNNYPDAKENSRRIVDCVNALEGIENPEQWVAMAKSHIDASNAQAEQNQRLKEQNDHWVKCIEELNEIHDKETLELETLNAFLMRFYFLSMENDVVKEALKIVHEDILKEPTFIELLQGGKI